MTDTYTITPPDLFLSNGKSILLLGINEDDVGDYQEIYDSVFPAAELVFFVTDKTTDENVAWLRAAITMCDEIIVDVENTDKPDMLMALFSLFDNNINKVFWICPDDSIYRKIIHAFGFVSFSNRNDFKDYLAE